MKIGDRIKKYELASKTTLLPRSYIVLRVDGKAFHTFTRGMKKPFDDKLIEAMVKAGERVAKEMMGFKMGYHQSDEFTFVLTDRDSYESQVWFDGEVQKLCSITASMFGAYFNKEMGGTEAVFDCRAFNVPVDDVANVFIWRQRDWERNSLQMFSRVYFSQKELHLKKKEDMHEMLFQKGQNWADLENIYKNGTFITKTGERIHKKMTYEDINEILESSNPFTPLTGHSPRNNMKKKQVYSEDGMRMVDWLVSDDTGASSISILIHMSGSKSMKNTAPSDRWDRGRCIRLLKLFPEWYERLDEMNVYTGWTEQIDLIKKEFNQ